MPDEYTSIKMSDTVLLIVLPFIVGFVGERFKDAPTIFYACFITSIFVALELYHCITLNSIMFGDLTCNLILFGGVLISAGIFHLQKWLRGKS